MKRHTLTINAMVALASICLLVASLHVQAGAQVEGIRIWPAPDHTRLVLDTEGKVEHNMFALSNPSRLVIDLKNRSEEHTSELQSRPHLVCRLLLEKKNNKNTILNTTPQYTTPFTADL